MSSTVDFERNGSSRATALLAEQNHILKMVTSGEPLPDTLRRLALLVESQIDRTRCTVLLFDQDGQVQATAAPSLPGEFVKAVDGITVQLSPELRVPDADLGETIAVDDIREDALGDNYRAVAIRHGLPVYWSAPFRSRHGHVLGTIAVHHESPCSPVAPEVQLLAFAGRVAGIAVDQCRTDAAHQRAAESYRGLVENLDGVVFSIDLHGHFTYISPAVERQSGFRADEIIGQPFHRFVHPDDVKLLQKSFADTLAGRLNPHEFRVISKNGVVRWCRTSSGLQMIGNQVVGVTGVMVNITDEKKTHEALNQAEEKYRTIFEEGVFGIFQSEPSGRYLTANPALARMFGYESPAEFVESITDISRDIYVDPGRRNEFLLLMEKDGRVRNFELQVYRKNRSLMWLSASARAIRENGRIVAFEGMIEEITQRKLMESQLLRAQKMEALGQLAGGIAHDFNNLLGVILGNGELLLKGISAGDPSRRRVEQIWRAGKRAACLAGQLLTFSRQKTSRTEVLDLNRIVQEARDLMAQVIGENVELIVHLHPIPNPIKADANQIEQILLNLAVNSRDAMPDGGRLTVETATVDVTQDFAQLHPGMIMGRYVSLRVSDTGIGMDLRTLERAFEPFFTTKEVGKGTGLGLASTYGIVKESGGHISVSSEPGKGTVFEIYLPFVEEPTRSAVKTDTQPALNGKNATVLVVEDTPDLRQVTREFLEEVGYHVLEADGSDMALQIAARHQGLISLMVTDVVMRGMSGRVLAQRLQSSRPDTRVLYVSGYADSALLRCGVSASEANFLRKPYTQIELARKIQEVLNTALLPQPTGTHPSHPANF